jgi:hypothetical protein
MTKYSSWTHYFTHNAWSLAEFPWSPEPQLSLEHRDLLALSLPSFQLGEGSGGAGLLRRAAQQSDPHLQAATQLFIREEQRHSAALGRFLDQEQIPRLRVHWVDTVFRRIRSLAGFELMTIVLTCAECLAVPYYTAVFELTQNHLLRSIAARILRDEAFHLEFQAENAALCAARRGDCLRLFTCLAHLFLLAGATAFVYLVYRPLFAQVNMSPLRFAALAFGAYRPILDRLARRPQSHRQDSLPRLAW